MAPKTEPFEARRLGPELEKQFMAGCLEMRIDWAMERGIAPRETVLKLRILKNKLMVGEHLDECEKFLIEWLAVSHMRENWLEDILEKW